MDIDFVLVAEGPSDYALVAPLKHLLIKLGATSVEGYAIDYSRVVDVGRDVQSKLAWAMENEGVADFFFVHRDADSRDSEPRRREIFDAAQACGCANFVPVVPVQALEAWLLVDEAGIRRLADNPRGRVPLSLPNALEAERLADPKSTLFDTLRTASGKTGRQLKRFNRKISGRRTRLVETIDVSGPVVALRSWMTLESDASLRLAEL